MPDFNPSPADKSPSINYNRPALGGSIAQPSVAASPWTYTNTSGRIVDLYLSGATTITSVVIDGINIGNTQVQQNVTVPINKAVVITYTGTLSAAAIGN